MLVDDYDLVAPAGAAGQPAAAARSSSCRRPRTSGCTWSLARRCGGAARALFDPVARQAAGARGPRSGDERQPGRGGAARNRQTAGRCPRAGPRSSTAGAATAMSSSPGSRPSPNRSRCLREPGGGPARHRAGAGGGRGSAAAAARRAAGAGGRSVRSGPRRVHRTARPACGRTPRRARLGAPPVVPATAAAVVRFVPAAVAALGSADAADDRRADRPVPDAVVVDAATAAPTWCDLAVGGSWRRVGSRSGARCSTPSRRSSSVASVPSRASADPSAGRGARRARGAVAAAGGRGRTSAGRAGRRRASRRAGPVAGRRSSTPSGRWLDGAGPAPPPVLLIGGVARTPLLAELLDAAGVPDVRVAERPDGAAVVGALRLPRAPARRDAPPDVPVDRAVRHPPAGPPDGVLASDLWLGPGTARSRALAVGAAAAVAVGRAARGGHRVAGGRPGPPAAAGDLVQYGYARAAAGRVGPHGWTAGTAAQPADAPRRARRQRPDLRRAHAARVRRRGRAAARPRRAAGGVRPRGGRRARRCPGSTTTPASRAGPS